MTYPKKSLRFVRFLLVLGLPIIWLIGCANIVFHYLSAKNNIVKLGDAADTVTLHLMEYFGQSTEATVFYQTLVMNAGMVLGVVFLSTAVLAIAISSIDMRNMEAVKRQRRREY